MLYILKQTEPPELAALRKTPIMEESDNLQETTARAANYKDLKDDTLLKVRTQLLEEQGYLCAYCMRQITDVRIEHQQPQAYFPDLDLEYSNFLGVCVGFYNINPNTHPDHLKPHCESIRSNKPLKINPLEAETVAQLKYTPNGLLISEDKTIDNDVNETLNLNLEFLRQKRLNVLDGFKKGLTLRYKNVSAAAYSQQTQKYSNFKDGKRYEYCGIILYYLQKELQKLQT